MSEEPPNGRPRLGYVVKMFPRFSETFILNELLELERLGHVVTVYSLKRPAREPVHPARERLKARVVYLPERPIAWLTRGGRDSLGLLGRAPLDTLRSLGYVASRGTHQAWKRFFQAAAMARDLRSHPVDRLHAHFASAPTRVAMFASRFAGVPFSFTAHAKDIYQAGTDLDLLRDKMRAASFVVTVSEFNRQYLTMLASDTTALSRRAWDGGRGSSPGTVAGSIRCLHNGVDLDRFSPSSASKPGDLVLAVGRLVEKKGFDDLLAAWRAVSARHPRTRLVVVGTGPEEERLRALAKRLGIEAGVTWAGAQTQDRLLDWMAQADVFCLPCRVAKDGNRDGLPTVLLEAMAAGVPCVSTALTGVPEIIRHGVDGLLVAPGDIEALGAALSQLLADPEARERMGRSARARAEERFDLHRNVARLAAWFQESA